jgi:NAD+ kinase
MKFKNILLLYKRSAYTIYSAKKDPLLLKNKKDSVRKEIEALHKAHDEHYQTLQYVVKTLLSLGVRFKESYRGCKIDYSSFDLIITVGGDGTFLEAARHAGAQVVVGVNSAPRFSVGKFCIMNKENFKNVIQKIIKGDSGISLLQRLKVDLKNNQEVIHVLNDVLICHVNPASICRYLIQVGSKIEKQRSSGVWIATAAGSTGAIQSAGGKRLKILDHRFQYHPRELYDGHNQRYQLKGTVLNSRQKIEVTSFMRRGMIFLDGAHVKSPFNFGETVRICLSSQPLKTIFI